MPDGIEVIVRSLPFLLVGTFPNGGLGGLALTAYLSLTIGASSFVLGATLGTIAALAPWPARGAVLVFTVVIRGVPALAFLFWFYFLLPRMLDINLSALLSAGIALTLYHGAYISEDVRGGFRSVPRGQWEAARSSGLSFATTLRHLILPQALRAIVPSLVSRFVNLVIYTSAVSILGILEFTRAAVLVNNRELLYSVYVFGFIGIVYFAICFGISQLGRALERRWTWVPASRVFHAAA
jgi:polar amino acid transport system permease protein